MFKIKLILIILLIILFISNCGKAELDQTKKKFSVQETKAEFRVVNSDKPAKGEWDFNLKELWSVDSIENNPLVNLNGINSSQEGNVYFIDKKYAHVYCLDKDGKFLFKFGRNGEGPGEFKRAQNLSINNNRIIVWDGSNRINHFSNKGEFILSYTPGVQLYPRVFINDNEYLTLKSDSDKFQDLETVMLYNLTNKTSKKIFEVLSERPVDAKSDSKFPTRIRIDEPEFTIALVMAYQDDYIYYGRNDKYEINKTNLNGEIKMTFSVNGKKRNDISQKYKDETIDSVKRMVKEMTKSHAKKLKEQIPDKCSYFTNIHVDETGLIYVFIPDTSSTNEQEIDIFSPKGKYLYNSTIKLSEGLSLVKDIVFYKDSLFVFVEDNEENRKLIKFKIDLPKM